MLLDHLPDVGYAFAFNFVNRQSDLLVHTLPASDKSARGPVNDVHSDFTAESFVIKGIEQRQEQLGLSGARCMIVNIWRPLCAPGESVSSWPLTVCDASSVRCASRGGKRVPSSPAQNLLVLLPRASLIRSSPLLTGRRAGRHAGACGGHRRA